MIAKQGAAFGRRWLLAGAAENALIDASAAEPLGISLNAVVNPVQSTTYHLQPTNSTITFGAATNIRVFGEGLAAVVGASAARYEVTNRGNLSSNGYYGVLLVSRGVVTNSGTITGTRGASWSTPASSPASTRTAMASSCAPAACRTAPPADFRVTSASTR